MNPNEIRQEASRLRREGLTVGEIAERIKRPPLKSLRALHGMLADIPVKTGGLETVGPVKVWGWLA